MIKFIAKSKQLQNIVKSLELTRRFYVSSLLVGEACIGKKTIARHIMPNAVMVDGEHLAEVLDALHKHEEIIIYNFEKIPNYSDLNFDNKRVIATARYQPKDSAVDELFGYIYEIPPLSERREDSEALAELFLTKAKELLGMQEAEVALNPEKFDLSENSRSLKRHLYKTLIFSQITEAEIEEMMYGFFERNIAGNNDYKKYLHLYERPLIEAGLKRYKSQLKLAGILGINRNTLRKKVNEYGL